MQGTVTFCRQWCLKSEYGICVCVNVETEFHLHFYIWPLTPWSIVPENLSLSLARNFPTFMELKVNYHVHKTLLT